MTLSRRLRLGLLGVIVTTTAVAALCGLPAPRAQAFLPQNHERITRDGLPPGEVDEAAFLQKMNQFDLAVLLAARQTTEVYQQVRSLVASNYGECAARNLFQADRHEPCWG
jgi:hypothetical protein